VSDPESEMEDAVLGVTISTGDNGCVIVTFDRAITAVEFSNNDAQDFALLILEAVEDSSKSSSKPAPEELN
jgi:hypothetical protein